MFSIKWLIAYATLFAPFIYFFIRAIAMLQAVKAAAPAVLPY